MKIRTLWSVVLLLIVLIGSTPVSADPPSSPWVLVSVTVVRVEDIDECTTAVFIERVYRRCNASGSPCAERRDLIVEYIDYCRTGPVEDVQQID